MKLFSSFTPKALKLLSVIGGIAVGGYTVLYVLFWWLPVWQLDRRLARVPKTWHLVDKQVAHAETHVEQHRVYETDLVPETAVAGMKAYAATMGLGVPYTYGCVDVSTMTTECEVLAGPGRQVRIHFQPPAVDGRPYRVVVFAQS